MSIKNPIQIALFSLLFLNLFSAALAQDVRIPNFWDKNERLVKPDLSDLQRLKFLTTTDFPPFNFVDRRKRLSGFHVELARAVCDELEILNRCQIQALPWEELQSSLEKGDAEAIIAGISVTGESRKVYDFSRAYMHIPGRFITRKDSSLRPPVYEALFKKRTGIVSGSTHEAFFKKVFANRTAKTYATKENAYKALLNGEVEAVFSDALSLSFWLGSEPANDCCTFLDEAFHSTVYFGNGLTIALPKNRPELVQAMDYALKRVNESSKFSELYLRYFPLGLY